MDYHLDTFPVPSDYFGILWALTGIKNAIVIEHGSAGNTSYNVMNYRVMNRQTPQGKLFSSGLDKDDVIMGKQDRLVEAIKELDKQFHPEVIFIVATSVTGVIGLDLEGIVFEIQNQVKAKLIAFPSGGFCGDYQWGIKKVFESLINEVVQLSDKKTDKLVNIIGPTTDTFNYQSDIAELERLLGLLDIKIHTVFTADTNVEKIRTMAEASLNLVIRDIGLDAAKLMKNKFGIPYIYGLPFGIQGTVEWLEKVAVLLDLKLEPYVLKRELMRYGSTLEELVGAGQRISTLQIAVACPYDYALGLVTFIRQQWGLKTNMVVLPVNPDKDDAVEELKALGVQVVLTEPENEVLTATLVNNKMDVIFGNYHHLQLAQDVPIKYHAAFPSFDYIYLYDGTPFVGFRGSAYLTQQLVNSVNQHVEVLR